MTVQSKADVRTPDDIAMPIALSDRLRARAQMLRVRAGQMVIVHGSASADVYFIIDGALEVLINARDGRAVVVRDLGVGALFGDLAAINGELRSATVIATTDSKIACVPSYEFLAAIAEVPGASEWMIRRLGHEVRRLTEKVFELSALPVRHRLHCELLRLAMAGEVTDGRALVRPTHEALAARIGSQREAVTRELSQLKRDGIARREHESLVVDLPGLARLVRAGLGQALPGEMLG